MNKKLAKVMKMWKGNGNIIIIIIITGIIIHRDETL